MAIYPDKAELWSAGVSHVGVFCSANAIRQPSITLVPTETWRFTACAFYRNWPGDGRVVGCLTRMAGIGTSGRMWSYPGWVVDRTPYGVIAHEIGHHVDAIFTSEGVTHPLDYETGIRVITAAKERPITSYAPNMQEQFAEYVRLFITNPDLLRRIRPATYAQLLSLRLVPVETRDYASVLSQAPERTRELAERRVMQGN